MEKNPPIDRKRSPQPLPQPVVLTAAEAKLVAGGPAPNPGGNRVPPALSGFQWG